MPKNPITEYVAADPSCQALIRFGEMSSRPLRPSSALPPDHYHYSEYEEPGEHCDAVRALENLRTRLIDDDSIPADATWARIDRIITNYMLELKP